MRTRYNIVAGAAAITLGTTGALVLPAVASAHNASHTLRFTGVRVSKLSFTDSTSGSEGKLVNGAGKKIGFDVVHTRIGRTTGTVNAVFDLKGGLLYGTLTTSNGTSFNGKVTGGTGTFDRATGSITARAVSSGTKVKIVYTS